MSTDILLILHLVPLLIVLATAIAIPIIAHRYISDIEKRLSNCSYVNDSRTNWEHAGLLGKVMRTGIIAIIVMFPNIHARRGLIDLQEIKRLPKFYKKMLTTPMLAGNISLVMLFIFQQIPILQLG